MNSPLSKMEPLVTLARNAGDAILTIYGADARDDEERRKKDHSPLAEADRKAYQIIARGLERLTPGYPVIPEEEGGLPAEAVLDDAESHWLVDSLDGAKEFEERSGEFTVNIALVRDGRPVVGIVHAPVLATTWIGAAGRAVRRDRRGDDTTLRGRSADPQHLSVTVGRDHSRWKLSRLRKRLPGSSIRAMGSSLGLCLVAQGEADLFLRDGRSMEWDTAAAQAVLEAAGGSVFTSDGDPLVYGKSRFRNPKLVAVGDQSLNWKSLL